MLFDGEDIVICHGVVDLRKGAGGLLALVTNARPRAWYLFSNRSRSLVKAVQMDGRGLWLVTRRIDQGVFKWLEKAEGASTISVRDASMICDGESLRQRFPRT